MLQAFAWRFYREWKIGSFGCAKLFHIEKDCREGDICAA